jgi:hypothetical protein
MANTSPNARPSPSNINPLNSPRTVTVHPAAAGTPEGGSANQAEPPRPILPGLSDGFMTPITPEEATELALSPAQYMAIDLMLQGNTLIASAKSAGVTRRTLYNWLHHDAKFRAAYNAWQADVVTSARSRILGMADDAANTLGIAVKTSGPLAFAVLKSLGAMEKPTPVSMDPEEIKQKMDLEKQEKENQLKEDEMFGAMGLTGGGTGSKRKK